jgi:F-type H+-transporting ATPase subunit epsilon
MATTLRLEIVTAEGPVYSDDAEMVTLPGVTGQFGGYPEHGPLITQMVAGEIIVHKDGHDTFFATGAGFIEVTGTCVGILTDLAVQANKIDEAKAEEARQRAEARLKEKLSDEEVAHINSSLARSLAQLRVKRRQRK